MVKSHGRRTAVRATSIVPSAPDSKRSRALAASSTVTGIPERERMNVVACAHVLSTGPAMASAMSIR